uniref:Uncharacterized protein n=1 Tax=Oryza brachyantha TaxID=4533 RepID=J3MNZ7_ORYBR
MPIETELFSKNLAAAALRESYISHRNHQNFEVAMQPVIEEEKQREAERGSQWQGRHEWLSCFCSLVYGSSGQQEEEGIGAVKTAGECCTLLLQLSSSGLQQQQQIDDAGRERRMHKCHFAFFAATNNNAAAATIWVGEEEQWLYTYGVEDLKVITNKDFPLTSFSMR